MDFSPLASSNIFGGSNLLRKMGWNYPSGALCLLKNWKFHTLKTITQKVKYFVGWFLTDWFFFINCINDRKLILFIYWYNELKETEISQTHHGNWNGELKLISKKESSSKMQKLVWHINLYSLLQYTFFYICRTVNFIYGWLLKTTIFFITRSIESWKGEN